MSVRNRIFLTVGGVLLLLVIALVVASQFILIGGFQQLEEQDTQANVERVTNTINDEIATLVSTTADWAHWDDTYEFIQDGNQTYIDDNLANETLGNLNLNLVIYINTEEEIIYSKAIDLETWEEIPLPDGIQNYLNVGDPLVTHPDETSSLGGVLLLPETPMMVASQPILTNENQGPIKGTLIFGRFLNAARIQALSDSLKLAFDVHSLNTELSVDYQTARSNLTGLSDVFVDPVNSRSIAGYALLGDVTGSPALLLRVTLDRDIITQGQKTFRFFAIALVIIALVGGLLTSVLLDRTVLSRIARLRNDVDQISTTGDLNYRVAIEGQDELSALASKLNEMLQALDAAEKAQRQSDERLRTLVNNAPLVVWSIGANRTVTLVDGNELKQLAVAPSEMIGKPASEWIGKIPLDETDLQKALAGETITATVKVGELSFEAHYLPLKDQKGQVTSVIGVATNITERLSAEEGMRLANQSLDQTNRQLRRAHELLRSTVEQMNDLIQHGSSADELRDSLAFIQGELSKLQD